MSATVTVPRLAESISEATLVEWLKPDGAAVRRDEPVATLETDKAAVEIAASDSGVLRHQKPAGATVVVGDVLATIEAGAAAADGQRGAGESSKSEPAAASTKGAPSPPPAKRAATPAPAKAPAPAASTALLPPAVRKLVEEHRLDPAAVAATGPGGRLLKEDVLRHLEQPAAATSPAAPPREAASAPAPAAPPQAAGAPAAPTHASPSNNGERIVPMSRLRQRIAERLVHSQHTAAILTTFNEVDMTEVLALRARWGETFQKRHGVKLGFMGLFARAVVLALDEVPELNAEIRGTDMVYHDGVHLGVAVGTERGLVVPVIRDAHALDVAGIEREVLRLAQRARDVKLTLDELAGGTFTISNGGVYGSLLSTPILNPPQSGILGMHKIQKRPIAVEGDRVEVHPMMYVALSYDHRIVDGEQAVTFLVRVKERLEHPERMLLGV